MAVVCGIMPESLPGKGFIRCKEYTKQFPKISEKYSNDVEDVL